MKAEKPTYAIIRTTNLSDGSEEEATLLDRTSSASDAEHVANEYTLGSFPPIGTRYIPNGHASPPQYRAVKIIDGAAPHEWWRTYVMLEARLDDHLTADEPDSTRPRWHGRELHFFCGDDEDAWAAQLRLVGVRYGYFVAQDEDLDGLPYPVLVKTI